MSEPVPVRPPYEGIPAADVAEALGVSNETIRVWCLNGRIRGCRANGRWWVRHDDFVEFANEYAKSFDTRIETEEISELPSDIRYS